MFSLDAFDAKLRKTNFCLLNPDKWVKMLIADIFINLVMFDENEHVQILTELA